MPRIHILDDSTVNQIAAGEVVERPSAIVKELIENAMDAGATAITAEIKEGGLSFIRITDNGFGIAREDIPLAFLRHATSKIRTAEDLLSVTSLGFRGEALSSIAAVSQLELITKTPSALNGFRYLIEGGEEKSLEEIGCPGGTTIIVRNIFYNTPARRKFLKSAMTEAGYISELMERLMISHPNISFKFIMNNQVKLQSSGNSSSKDILYQIYGRDITRELLPVEFHSEDVKITGFIGKPIITRGNRNYENYFINGRYIKSNVITKAIEEAYKPYMMQHKYPFTSLYFEIEPSLIDVNVHPQKMEIRLKNGEEIYRSTAQVIHNVLAGKEIIPQIRLTPQVTEEKKTVNAPEPFEENRRKLLEAQSNSGRTDSGSNQSLQSKTGFPTGKTDSVMNTSSVNYENKKDYLPENRVAEYNTYHLNHNNLSNSQISTSNSNTLNENGQELQINQGKLRSTNPNYSGQELTNQEVKESTSNVDRSIPSNLITEGINTSNSKSFNELFGKLEPDKSEVGQSELEKSGVNTSETDKLTEEKLEAEKSESRQSELVKFGAEKFEIEKLADEDFEAGTSEINDIEKITTAEQITLFNNSAADTSSPFLSEQAVKEHRIIGQIFSTYWLVEYKKELYIIDQHAAHEKVLYEKIMAAAKSKSFSSQQLLPPIVLSLSIREQEVVNRHQETLSSLGYEIEHFGGNEFSVRAVPSDLYGISEKALLMEFIDELVDDMSISSSNMSTVLEKIASLSCKAAVKANHTLTMEEAQSLIQQLLVLENPYNCPHGRPVIISMSQHELERKFKRIIN